MDEESRQGEVEREQRMALLAMLEDLEKSREKIEHARQQWTAVFDAVRDAIFIHDRDHRIVRANRAYAERAGMDVHELIGKPYWQVFPKGSGPLPCCRHAKQEAEEAEEEAEEEEAEMKLEGGEIFRSRSFAIHSEEGAYQYSVHILENITEKRRAEAERCLLTEAIRQAAEAIVVVNAAGRISYVNPAFTRLFGYPPEEVIGESTAILAVPGAETLQPAEALRIVREQGGFQGEVLRRTRDGTVLPVYTNVAALYGAEGGFEGFVTAITDLRPIREAQQALVESEEMFRSIFEGALDGILLADAETRKFLTGNPMICRMLGHTPEELTRLGVSDIHPERDLPYVAEQFERQLRGEIQLASDIPVRRKDGSVFYADIKSSPVRLGGRTCLLGVFRDITERRQAEEALRRSNRALRVLSACNETLVHADEEGKLLQDMCGLIVEKGGYRLAWIGFAQNDEVKTIRPVAHAGAEEGYLGSLHLTWADAERGRGPAGSAIRSGEPVVAQNIRTEPAFEPWRKEAMARGYASCAALPLRTNGKILGTLNIYAAEEDAFHPEEVKLLQELANDITFGIHTLRLRQENRVAAGHLRDALTGTIGAVALTVEKRDPYTAGHQQRVAQLAVAIAEELGIDGEQIEGIRLGALIHDIGKIYVPAEILSRPGKLTTMEFEIIKMHPQVGYDIIKDVRFPWPVGEMILQHHERLDGSGYPLGLQGDAIISEARILAVADVVEAMTSHRPYRPAIGPDTALQAIADGRGTRFDAAAVDACIRLFHEHGFTLPAHEANHR